MTTGQPQFLGDSPDERPLPVSEEPHGTDETSVVTSEPELAGDATAPRVAASEAEPPDTRRESSTEKSLLADDDLGELRARWAGVQAAFVDNPKDCVQKADALVSDLVEQLTRGFGQARSRLEEQWARGKEASTEDLRLALMHYREFFERLLAI